MAAMTSLTRPASVVKAHVEVKRPAPPLELGLELPPEAPAEALAELLPAALVVGLMVGLVPLPDPLLELAALVLTTMMTHTLVFWSIIIFALDGLWISKLAR